MSKQEKQPEVVNNAIHRAGFADEIGVVMGGQQVKNIAGIDKMTLRKTRSLTNKKTALLSTGGSIFRSLEKLPMIGPGLYNWFVIYDSDIVNTKQLDPENPARTLENYEVIFVNMAGQDIGLASRIRKWLGTNSSTKLVVINDYSIELMQKILQETGQHYYEYIVDLMSADLLVAQEPFEYEIMATLVEANKKSNSLAGLDSQYPEMALISHPVDTVKLKPLAVELDKRMPQISMMYHRFDGHTFLPATLLHNQATLNSWFNQSSLYNILIGYTDKYNIIGGKDRLFNAVFDMLPWGVYVQILASSVIAADYYTISSHSRFSSECACLKIPLVSTSHSFNATKLYPEITHDYRDLRKIKEEISKLIVDENHWNRVVDFAYENVEQFNYDNSFKKMEATLQDGARGLVTLDEEVKKKA